MSFPLSPTNNQVAVVNGITYSYSSTNNAWKRVLMSNINAITVANTTSLYGQVFVNNSLSSGSTTTGAMLVTGGVGIQGSMYAGAVYDGTNRVVSTSSGAGNLTVAGTGVNLTAIGPGSAQWGGTTQLPVVSTDVYGRVVSASNIALNTIVVTQAGNTANITANAGVGQVGFDLTNTTVTPGVYGSNVSIPTVVVDAKGRVTNITTNNISTSFTLSGTSGTTTVSGASTLNLAGTYGVTVAVGSEYANISTPQDIRTTANPTFSNLVLTGNITTTGNSTSGNVYTGGLFWSGNGNPMIVPGSNNPTMYTSVAMVSTSSTLVDTVPVTGNSFFRWTVVSNDTVNNHYSSSMIDTINDGTNVYLTQTGVIKTNPSYSVATFSSTISGGNINLYAVGDSTMVRVSFERTTLGSSTYAGYLNVGPTGATGAVGPAGSISNTSGNIVTTSANIANNFTSGALQVPSGGASIAGNVYAGSVYTGGLYWSNNNNPMSTGGSITGLAGFTANSSLVVGYSTAATSTTTGALQVDGGLGVQGAIYAGSLQNTPVGSTTASTGAFTTLSATSTVSGVGFSNYLASPPSIGSTTASSGAFTTLNSSSTTSLGATTATSLNSTPIGASTASTGAFTTLTSSGATTLTNSTQSTSTSTGALVVTGGTGIGANLYVAGNSVISGSEYITGSSTIAGNITANYISANVVMPPAVSVVPANYVGYIGIPQNAQTGAYTLVMTDIGKQIYLSSASSTITIPANSSVAFPIGTTISFATAPSITMTIAISTDTMYLTGSSSTGSRTLAGTGLAAATKVASTTWYINGIGLT